jgi:membrane-bound lytic murein transglycosylase MltF
VLVPYSHTEFFVSKGKPGGFVYETMLRVQEWLDRDRPGDVATLSILLVPTPTERLLPDLLAGRGDVAAGLLTVTPARQREAAFTPPAIAGVDEVVVRHQDAPSVASAEDLSGRTVHVLAGSSQAEHLRDLNGRLVASGRAPATVVELPAPASREDLLQLASAGAVQYAIADDFLADLWSKVLQGLRVEPTACVARGGEIAWAVRPGNPELLRALSGFVGQRSKEARLASAVIFRRYFENSRVVRNDVGRAEMARFAELSGLFREAGEKFGLDWRLLGAQALQESQLDPKARNPSGAVGLMQLLPQTALQMGYPDVESPRSNVLAGAAYMDHLRDTYFSEAGLDPAERLLFSLAAYNAGPRTVRDLRSRARRVGLDPNRWFGHVAIVAQHVLGDETVSYVANINRYDLAYRLSPPAFPGDQAPAR